MQDRCFGLCFPGKNLFSMAWKVVTAVLGVFGFTCRRFKWKKKSMIIPIGLTPLIGFRNSYQGEIVVDISDPCIWLLLHNSINCICHVSNSSLFKVLANVAFIPLTLWIVVPWRVEGYMSNRPDRKKDTLLPLGMIRYIKEFVLDSRIIYGERTSRKK